MRRFWKRHPEIVRVEVVDVGPDDIVILETDEPLTAEEADCLRERWETAISDGRKTIILSMVRAKVLRKTEP